MKKRGNSHRQKRGRRGSTDLGALFYRQRGLCKYCKRPMVLGGASLASATRDHVLPRAAGGKQAGNLVAACRSCNQKKAAKDAAHFKKMIAIGADIPAASLNKDTSND